MALCQVIHQAKRLDQGIAGVEDFHGVAVVSMQFSNHQDKVGKDKEHNPLQQLLHRKNRSITHKWAIINVIATKDGDIWLMSAQRLSKVISVVVVVVEDIPEEEPQEGEEEEETFNMAVEETRQLMPP